MGFIMDGIEAEGMTGITRMGSCCGGLAAIFGRIWAGWGRSAASFCSTR
jgi:hypothetical protein